MRRKSKFQKLISQVLRYEAEGKYIYSDFSEKKFSLIYSLHFAKSCEIIEYCFDFSGAKLFVTPNELLIELKKNRHVV